MATDDLFALTPVPQLDLPSLGVPDGPVAPQLPPLSAPIAQRPNQKALTLATLAAMVTGGPNLAGLGQGVLHGQSLLEQQRQQSDHENRLRYEDEAQAFRVQQQAWQQQVSARQKVVMDAVTGLRQQVSAKAFTSKAAYDAAVEQTSSLLNNAYGIRVTPNFFREAAGYVAPDATKLAREAFEGILKAPGSSDLIKSNPEAFYNGFVMVDLNGDGAAEKRSIREVLAQANYSVVQDEQGQPIHTPKETDGRMGTPFQELLKSGLAQFTVENRREPTAKERESIIRKAQEQSKEKPAGDPSLVALAAETAGLRRDLLAQQLETARQPKPEKEPTQSQFTAAGYAARVEQANGLLDGLERAIAGMRTVSFKAQEQVPPALQSGAFQSYDQAARNFINAVLRRESGAVISPAEFDNARRQYLPQPGDKPATLIQKKQNRDQALASLKSASGRAYEAPVRAIDPAETARQKLLNRPSHGK